MLPFPATTAKRPLSSSSSSSLFTRLDYLVAYIATSLFATFLISFLYTRTEYKFPFPYVVNCIQLAIAWLITKTPLASLSLLTLSQAPQTLTTPTTKAETAKLLAPVTAAYIGWLVVNPLFLTHVPINAYQAFTALALPFSLVLTHILLLPKTTPAIATIAACGVYYIGSWFSCSSSGGFGMTSWRGTCLGIANSLFLALYGVLTKRCLSSTVDPWTLLRHNSGWGCLIMIPFGIYNLHTWPGPVPAFIDELGFWFQMVLTGLMGLGLQLITVVLIKLSSPIMQTSAAGVKVCLQTVLAAAILGNPLSKMSIFGTALALTGACWSIYTSGLRKN